MVRLYNPVLCYSVFTVTTPTKADQPESPVEEVDIGEVDVAVEGKV